MSPANRSESQCNGLTTRTAIPTKGTRMNTDRPERNYKNVMSGSGSRRKGPVKLMTSEITRTHLKNTET